MDPRNVMWVALENHCFREILYLFLEPFINLFIFVGKFSCSKLLNCEEVQKSSQLDWFSPNLVRVKIFSGPVNFSSVPYTVYRNNCNTLRKRLWLRKDARFGSKEEHWAHKIHCFTQNFDNFGEITVRIREKKTSL